MFYGVLFGIFPSWWLASAIVIHNNFAENKTLPNWLKSLAFSNPFVGLFSFVLLKWRYYSTALRILSIAYVCIFVTVVQWAISSDYSRGLALSGEFPLAEIIPLSLLVTWLTPSYFVRRYLSRQPSSGNYPKA